MSFVRDFFTKPARTNVPLTRVTSAPESDRSEEVRLFEPEPGPSTTPATRPVHPRAVTLRSHSVPPYDEDEDFNCRAPQGSADSSRLYPPSAGEPTGSLSVCSTANNTPLPSRAPSPTPFYYSGTSSCDSDSESDSDSSGETLRPHWRDYDRPRWWEIRLRSGANGEAWNRRRRWRDVIWGLRSCKRLARRLVRHPFFPKTPVTIVRSHFFSPVRRFDGCLPCSIPLFSAIMLLCVDIGWMRAIRFIRAHSRRDDGCTLFFARRFPNSWARS